MAQTREHGERRCGTRGLCCKITGVSEIGKAAGAWCPQWSASGGCAIYASHPEPCRIFDCWWRSDASAPEVWNPVKAHVGAARGLPRCCAAQAGAFEAGTTIERDQ